MAFTYPRHILNRIIPKRINTFGSKRITNLNYKPMLSTDDVAKVYDTILSIPGMNEIVKIDLKITRKNVLLLNRVMECA
jgi:hypothetical protein